jgi:hypothetical protein
LESGFPYSAVERALARVHLIPEATMGLFRGRLQHLQRLGMVPASPGRGRKISYEKSDVFLWAFALEIAEFGIDPKVFRKMVEISWPAVSPHLLKESGAPDRYFFFSPSFIGKDFPKTYQQTLNNQRGVPFSFTPRVISTLSELEALAGSHPLALRTLDRFMSRYGMINLSRLRREVESALAA